MVETDWTWGDKRPPPVGGLGFNNARRRAVHVKSRLHPEHGAPTSTGPHTISGGSSEVLPLPPSPESSGSELPAVKLTVEVYLDPEEANSEHGMPTGTVSADFAATHRDNRSGELQLVFLRDPPEGYTDATLFVYRDNSTNTPPCIGHGHAFIGE